MTMPDFGRWGGNGGDPSLNAIARTDQYLDALASEHPVYAGDPADAELANLMAGWRDEVRRPTATVALQRDAEIALQRALASQRRNRMSVAVMGSVAAAMLCLGGFGALVYGAAPGDALYGLRVAVFGEPQVTRDDQVALAAQTEMQQVQQLIEQGNWDAAQDKLSTITSTVQTVEDPQRQQNLQQQLNDLTAKVETRDLNATAPPLPDVSVVPNASVPSPPGPISLPPLPQLPPSVPGIPLPGISLPQLPPIPQLPIPGPGVPPDISLPDLPLPKPPAGLPKPIPGEQKPNPDAPKPQPQAPDAPKPAPKPPIELPKPIEQPKPVEPQKPIELPKPIEQPKPVEQPKPLIPEILPMPKPAPVPAAPPVQEAPPEPVIPAAPKAPPALAPAPEAPQEQPETTFPPVPGEKPGRGNGN
jgi:Anti-sigma-D factor RsdA to sigma factor binding region